ncbi:MAG: MBL fold metallo-hydrolase [Acidobacteria bacterium]|nr:MBL fold metallo-hydrolase [Acidobacteriota bacterium]
MINSRFIVKERIGIFLVIALLVFGSFVLGDSNQDTNRKVYQIQKQDVTDMVFALYIGLPSDTRQAEMLIKSLNEFGGKYKDSLFLVFYNPDFGESYKWLEKYNVKTFPLKIDSEAAKIPFAHKVYAAAQAEEMLDGAGCNLVYFDNHMFFLKEPSFLSLSDNVEAVTTSVYLTNGIGEEKEKEISPFWSGIYKEVGINRDEVPFVETVVDSKNVRFYINCRVVSVRPEKKILRQWRDTFEKLAKDKEYVGKACTSRMQYTFLHQAVISAILLKKPGFNKIKLLDQKNFYPLLHHEKLPEGKKISDFSGIDVLVDESYIQSHPDWAKEFKIDASVKNWLETTVMESLKITDNLYRLENSCNSYLARTSTGNVMLDPGGASKEGNWLYKMAHGGDVKAILLTHGHDDHTEGIDLWKNGKDIPVIAQREYENFVRYNSMLDSIEKIRIAKQTGQDIPQPTVETKVPVLKATELFIDNYTYKSGDRSFVMTHVGGETPDQCVIWIPEIKTVLIGDNYYSSVPNMSTLRGSETRPALEYIKALETALSYEPEILLPGHGEPLIGKDFIKMKLTKYRDAVRYIHDETVKGMNLGKDVHTLMKEIKLPDEISIPEAFGRVSWDVRGIFEGYLGWYDTNISNMYPVPTSDIYPDLVALIGDAGKVAAKASALVAEGEPVKALHMTDIILIHNPKHLPALKARLEAINNLRSKCRNWIEFNWLNSEMKKVQSAIAEQEKTESKK